MEESQIKWELNIVKWPKGYQSFGIYLTRDANLDEYYIYINLFKWSISIGRLLDYSHNNEEDEPTN